MCNIFVVCNTSILCFCPSFERLSKAVLAFTHSVSSSAVTLKSVSSFSSPPLYLSKLLLFSLCLRFFFSLFDNHVCSYSASSVTTVKPRRFCLPAKVSLTPVLQDATPCPREREAEAQVLPGGGGVNNQASANAADAPPPSAAHSLAPSAPFCHIYLSITK